MREMLNMTVLTGRLTADPELKHTENHIPYTRFTLAVDRPYAKKGEERETDFIDIAAWRRQAEFACRHFTKGRAMTVQGFICTRRYADRRGESRRSFQVTAREIYFADFTSREQPAQEPEAPPDSIAEEEASPAEEDAFAFLDEDLPF